MFYFKVLPARNQRTPKQKISHDVSGLFFLGGVYERKRKQLLTTIRNQRADLLVDVSAALMAQLYANKFITRRLLLRGLQLCRDQITGQGYRGTLPNRLNRVLGSRANIVFVPGCQGRGSLRGRVLAAVALCDLLTGDLSVVFSGAHPPRESVAIPVEAVRAEDIFREAIASNKRLWKRVHLFSIETEVHSKTTQQNIEKLLDLEPMKAKGPKNLLVVSSTFHIPRIAPILEARAKAKAPSVKGILLAPSEPVGRLTSTSRKARYAKQVFFVLAGTIFRGTLEQGAAPIADDYDW